MSSNYCDQGGNKSGMPYLGENEEPEWLRDLDLSQWERITPSYQRLPLAYAHPQQCSEHDSFGVLNDKVVSWIQMPETSAADDEELPILGEKEQLEDKRYELDLLEVVITKLKEVIRGVQDKKIKLDVPFSLKDHLPAYCIGFLRTVKGMEAIEKKNKDMLQYMSKLLQTERETSANLLQKERDRQEESKGENSRKRKKPSWTGDERETSANLLQKERDRQEESKGENSRKRKKPSWTGDYEM